MISDKLKQDAATITSELKVIATKMPLVFHNYDYLNEKASVVLKRRKGQLGEIKSEVREFLNDNGRFCEVVHSCEKDLRLMNNELKMFGVDLQASSTSNNNSDRRYSDNSASDGSSNISGELVDDIRKFTISRQDSFVPDTPAMKCKKSFNL